MNAFSYILIAFPAFLLINGKLSPFLAFAAAPKAEPK